MSLPPAPERDIAAYSSTVAKAALKIAEIGDVRRELANAEAKVKSLTAKLRHLESLESEIRNSNDEIRRRRKVFDEVMQQLEAHTSVPETSSANTTTTTVTTATSRTQSNAIAPQQQSLVVVAPAVLAVVAVDNGSAIKEDPGSELYCGPMVRDPKTTTQEGRVYVNNRIGLILKGSEYRDGGRVGKAGDGVQQLLEQSGQLYTPEVEAELLGYLSRIEIRVTSNRKHSLQVKHTAEKHGDTCWCRKQWCTKVKKPIRSAVSLASVLFNVFRSAKEIREKRTKSPTKKKQARVSENAPSNSETEDEVETSAEEESDEEDSEEEESEEEESEEEDSEEEDSEEEGSEEEELEDESDLEVAREKDNEQRSASSPHSSPSEVLVYESSMIRNPLNLPSKVAAFVTERVDYIIYGKCNGKRVEGVSQLMGEDFNDVVALKIENYLRGVSLKTRQRTKCLEVERWSHNPGAGTGLCWCKGEWCEKRPKNVTNMEDLAAIMRDVYIASTKEESDMPERKKAKRHSADVREELCEPLIKSARQTPKDVFINKLIEEVLEESKLLINTQYRDRSVVELTEYMKEILVTIVPGSRPGGFVLKSARHMCAKASSAGLCWCKDHWKWKDITENCTSADMSRVLCTIFGYKHPNAMYAMSQATPEEDSF